LSGLVGKASIKKQWLIAVIVRVLSVSGRMELADFPLNVIIAIVFVLLLEILRYLLAIIKDEKNEGVHEDIDEVSEGQETIGDTAKRSEERTE
jgi:hypothetical protein